MKYYHHKIHRTALLILKKRRGQVFFIGFLSIILPLLAVAGVVFIRVYFAGAISAWLAFHQLPFSLQLLHAAAQILLCILAVCPFLLGVRRWFCLLAYPEWMRQSSVFYYFGSVTRYLKAVFCGILQFFAYVASAVASFAPAVLVLVGTCRIYTATQKTVVESLCVLGLGGSLLLFVAGALLCFYLCSYLFWVPYLLAQNPRQGVVKIFRTSYKLTQKNREALHVLRQGLFAERLLALFIIPAIFTHAKSQVTAAVWVRGFCERPAVAVQKFSPRRSRRFLKKSFTKYGSAYSS